MQNKINLTRTIYLYLFSLVGLVLVIIAGVRFIDMGLKAWVFTKAEQADYSYPNPPEAMTVSPTQKLAENVIDCSEKCGFTDEEVKLAKDWLEDYKTWVDSSKKIDYIASRRHADAANSLAMLIIGLPLYFYHWKLATKPSKEENQIEIS